MKYLPVRIELTCDSVKMFCRFTIDNIPFYTDPKSGDPINFDDIKVVMITRYAYHVVSSNADDGRSGCLVYCTKPFDDFDLMLATFDRFKDSYEILDIDVCDVPLPSYYPSYRTLIKVWGKKTFEHGIDHPMSLAETIRAIYLAGGGANDQYISRTIEEFHKFVISHKASKLSDSIDLLDLMRLHHGSILCDKMRLADAVAAMPIAVKLFLALKSVPRDKLPGPLKDLINDAVDSAIQQ